MRYELTLENGPNALNWISRSRIINPEMVIYN